MGVLMEGFDDIQKMLNDFYSSLDTLKAGYEKEEKEKQER